jgi:hypothetical protein
MTPMVSLRRLVREGRSDAPGQVVDVLGRIGLVGYGVVHLLVAWLALAVAFGIPDDPPDAQGAVATIADTPGGTLALGMGAFCLLAFALWQITAAAIGFRWVRGGERVRKRAGAVAKSIATGSLAVLVVDSLVAHGRQSTTSAQSLAAALLALPAGRFLLGAVACVILVLAGTMTYTGVRRTFMGDLDLRRVNDLTRRAIEVLGMAGTLSRALALAVVGLLAGGAALFEDPNRAGGLDTALRALGSTALGASLLVVVAVGFAAFGLFCVADAATRRA